MYEISRTAFSPFFAHRNTHMKYLSFLFLITFSLVACQNKRVKSLYAKPKALGAIGEVGIVTHDSIWEGRQGRSLRTFLQKDALFTCLHIQPTDTIHFAGLHRNLVYLNLASHDKREFHEKRGTFQHLDNMLVDERAFGQISQYITRSPTDTTHWEKICQYIRQHEISRLRTYTYGFEVSQSTVLERWISTHYPFRLRVLPEFQVWKKSSQMLWLKTDRGIEKHIYIFKISEQVADCLPKGYTTKHYVMHTIWRNGWQAVMFMPILMPIDKRKEALQHLALGAILETFN